MPSGETSGVEVLWLRTDETPWRLLQALRTGDRRVNELDEQTGRPQNLVSYHLGSVWPPGQLVERVVLWLVGERLPALGDQILTPTQWLLG